MNEFIEGTCEQMCPKQEIKMRIKEHLIHFYEFKDQKNNICDENKMIKEFARSAAGVRAPKKSDLRTIETLHKTIIYLMKEILPDRRKPYYFVYDFIFDRLRSIRQEIVMQNVNNSTKILLLQPIILFLSYSCYRLSEEEISKFDPKICQQHLQECLKILLCCYDDGDRYNNENITGTEFRELFEALYILLNLGNVDAINRGLKQSKNIKKSLLKLALKMSIAYFQQNLYLVLLYIDKLPHILCAIASLKLQEIRREIYLRFSIAYHAPSAATTVSLKWLCKLLLYENEQQLIDDCKYYNIEIIKNNNNNLRNIKFNKNTINKSKLALKQRFVKFVELKLQKNAIEDIILLTT